MILLRNLRDFMEIKDGLRMRSPMRFHLDLLEDNKEISCKIINESLTRFFRGCSFCLE